MQRAMRVVPSHCHRHRRPPITLHDKERIDVYPGPWPLGAGGGGGVEPLVYAIWVTIRIRSKQNLLDLSPF